MRKLVLAGLMALSVAIAGPVLAAAHGRPKHRCSLNLTASFAEIKRNSGNPPFSGSNTEAATVDGTLCGKPFHGAARDVNHFPTLGKFNGVAITFGPLGSIKATFQGIATEHPDHSASLHGTVTITGGTGLYKDATGSNSFTGAQPANSPVTTQHLTGTLNH